MNRPLLGAALLAAMPSAAFAALSASAVLTPSGSGPYHYDGVLTNLGDTTVGTFWYSWIPGEDFLLTSPTSITSPAGWISSITHLPATSSNGFAIQWKATSAASDISAGGALSGFGFNTTDTPGQVAGSSAYYPGTPVGTSFVYSGAPFSDGGFQFVATTAPEPASIGIIGLGIACLLRRGQGRIR